jgi:hypothetical protein
MRGEANTSNAVAAALARARRHAGTAATAAMLAPLALGAIATPAAASAVGPQSSITGSTTSVGDVTTFHYTLSVNGNAINPIYQIELPELHSGDFNLLTFTGPAGWSAAQEATSQYTTTTFKDASLTPGAYVLLSTHTSGIFEGNSANFSLSTTTPGVLNANFSYSYGSFSPPAEGFVQTSAGSADPPVPGTANSIPEPASLGLLGLAAALTMVRRRRT